MASTLWNGQPSNIREVEPSLGELPGGLLQPQPLYILCITGWGVNPVWEG